MVNYIFKKVSGKELIMYDRHRNTAPIADHADNRKDFMFWSLGNIWKCIPLKNKHKLKHRIMYGILTILNPKYILSMNWISKRESLYKVWTAKRPKSQFIVVQHGGYVGGFVTDIPHRYTKCDVFLTWGPYFTEQFKGYNSLKNVEILSFGNPVYNAYNREVFGYKQSQSHKILLLPTALDEPNVKHIQVLIKKLSALNFRVTLKEHAMQGTSKDAHGNLRFPSIEGVEKKQGNLYHLLQNNDFDAVICDHSSSLLDVIFFKNKVLYFDPNNNKSYKTRYSQYLENLFTQDLDTMTAKNLYDLINIPQQELLLNDMLFSGNNILKNLNKHA